MWLQVTVRNDAACAAAAVERIGTSALEVTVVNEQRSRAWLSAVVKYLKKHRHSSEEPVELGKLAIEAPRPGGVDKSGSVMRVLETKQKEFGPIVTREASACFVGLAPLDWSQAHPLASSTAQRSAVHEPSGDLRTLLLKKNKVVLKSQSAIKAEWDQELETMV